MVGGRNPSFSLICTGGWCQKKVFGEEGMEGKGEPKCERCMSFVGIGGFSGGSWLEMVVDGRRWWSMASWRVYVWFLKLQKSLARLSCG